MKKIILFATFFLLFLVLHLTAYALVDRNPRGQEPQFAANEIIVKYKPNQSPDELAALLQKKVMRKKTIAGFFQVFFEDVSTWIHKQETLEAKIKRLEETDKKAGVIAKKPVFSNPTPELANIYLLTLKENSNVLETIALYKTLPEVEYAEPNHTLHIMQ